MPLTVLRVILQFPKLLNNMPAKESNSIDTILAIFRGIGLCIMAAGIMLAWFPDKIENYLGEMPPEQTSNLGGILIVFGLMDLLILPRLLKKHKKKRDND